MVQCAVLAMLAVLDILRRVRRAAEHAMRYSYVRESNTHVKDTEKERKSKRQLKRGDSSANELLAARWNEVRVEVLMVRVVRDEGDW